MYKAAAVVESLCLTIWVGGMVAVAATATVLFDKIADRSMAGEVAGSLFAIINYVGIVCAILLILILLLRGQTKVIKFWRLWVIMLMLIVIGVSQWGLRPRMDQLQSLKAAAQDQDTIIQLQQKFGRMHSVAGSLYLLNCIFGLILVVTAQPLRKRNYV